MRIGLTQRILFHNGQAYDATQQGWYQYLKGHTLVPVANRLDQDFTELAKDLDAVIITGGDDSSLRRTVELRLASQATLDKKPVVGICHGCFLLAEVLGSTITAVAEHYNTQHIVNYRNETVEVNSYHGLAIKELHSSARALVTDLDNNIEAWIDGTTAGIVWHPERMSNPWIPKEIKDLLKL